MSSYYLDDATCPNCGGTTIVAIDFGSDFGYSYECKTPWCTYTSRDPKVFEQTASEQLKGGE